MSAGVAVLIDLSPPWKRWTLSDTEAPWASFAVAGRCLCTRNRVRGPVPSRNLKARPGNGAARPGEARSI
jgi:hypothetical protein